MDLTKPHQLDPVAKLNGFADAKEMFEWTSSRDISTAENVRAFKAWQHDDGTKEGIRKLPVKPGWKEPALQIVLNEGGTKQRTVPITEIRVPGLWHIAMRAKNEQEHQAIIDCWHLAHDLLKALRKANGLPPQPPSV